MKTALLLIAHGSRNAEANEDLHVLARELRTNGEYAIVEPAFLELVTPTIDRAAQTCVAHGAERVILLPYFLSAGVHVRRDLEAHRDRLAQAHSDVSFVLAEPLGPHRLLNEIVLQRAREAKETRTK
jgi:sirohydrochlorin ferrochelatase